MGEKTILDMFNSKKINYVLILLGLILLFGFYLRFYHINYPVIGYHNWKSAHYLTEARNFADEGFFKEGFFVPMRDTMNGIAEPESGAHNDTFPLDPIIIAIFFKIFGQSLVVARLVEIFFSLGAIIGFYLFIKELFNNERLALLCAFLSAINPLFVFFSHNIQLVNSALFFMMFGLYFYAKWLKDIKVSKHLYLAALFIAISAMTKYTFIVIAIPILFSFPFKKIFKTPKKFYNILIIAALISLIFPAWLLYSEIYVKQKTIGHLLTNQAAIEGYSLTSLIDFTIIGDKAFWQTIRAYAADNYTLLGVNLALIGSIFLAYVFFIKNNKSEPYKFMFGYFFSVFVFLFVMGFKLSGHNYHQFPVAPYILFAIAFLVEFIAENINQFFSDKKLHNIVFLCVAIFIVFILWTPSAAARNRMFDTQFPGLDIAGDYINQHKLPGERVVHSSGQSFGFLWHANMPGYKGPGTIENMQEAVNDYNISWIFAYQWGIQYYMQDPVIFQYIKENFHLVQFAYNLNNNNQAIPIYFLFKKGGSFDDSKLNELLANKPIQKTQYHYTKGPYEIYHIDLE